MRMLENNGPGRNGSKRKTTPIISNFLKNRGGYPTPLRILRIKNNNKKHKEKNKEE